MENLDIYPLSSNYELVDWLSLLRQSGYAYEDKHEYFEAAERQVRALGNVDTVNLYPSTTLLAIRNHRCVGTITVSKFADLSWIIHHFATDRDVEDVLVARRLLSKILEVVITNRTARFVLYHIREANISVNRLFDHLFTSLLAIDRNAARRRVVAVCPFSNISDGRTAANITTRVLPKAEHAALKITSGDALMDGALAWGEALRDVTQTMAEYARASLTRHRSIVEVRLKEVVAGHALYDAMPPLLNLSGLLCSCALFLSPHFTEHEANLTQALLSRVLALHETHSHGRVTLAMPPLATRKIMGADLGTCREYKQTVVDLEVLRANPTLTRRLF